MAVHGRYNYLHISLRCLGNVNYDSLFFKFLFQIYCFVSGFSFAIVSTVINEANDLIVARDS